VAIRNLYGFCRQQRLDSPSMLRWSQGRSQLKFHPGRAHKDGVRKRDYVKTYAGFIKPDGRQVAAITNLPAFWRRHGLVNAHRVAVADRRIIGHRGWTYEDGKKRLAPQKYTGFIEPDRRRAAIINLCLFAEKAA
jgi:hypothetical protein